MKLLWHRSWHEAPCYSISPGGRLLRVEATRPLARVREASGRVLRRPLRKVGRFLLMEGPTATYRKAQTKRSEGRYSGDYRAVARSLNAAGLGRAVARDVEGHEMIRVHIQPVFVVRRQCEILKG